MTTVFADVDLDAVLADGTVAHIRTTNPQDASELARLHDRAGDRSLYLRFFCLGRDVVRRHLALLAQPASAERYSLVAVVDRRVVGVAEFERINDTDAEMALFIDDQRHHAGIGTLLTEHLAAVARRFGYRRFIAEVLAENTGVLRMLGALGLPVQRAFEGVTQKLVIDLQPDAGSIVASDEREAHADVISLAAILAPASVAVVGVCRRTSYGAAVTRTSLGMPPTHWIATPSPLPVLSRRQDVIMS